MQNIRLLTTLALCTLAWLHAPSLVFATSQQETEQHLLQFAANNTEFHKHIEAKAKKTYTLTQIGCPQITQAARQLPKSLGSLTIADSIVNPQNPSQLIFPAPTAGIWSEHVKIVACQKIYQINFLAIGRNEPGAAPLLLTTLPGSTITEPALQTQAIRIGGNTISRADNNSCSDTPSAANTRFIGFMASDRKSISPTDTQNGWFEEWDYHFCNETKTVQIAFLPSKDGAIDINARLSPKPE